MRALVSGAGGFVGRALADSLRADGHEVVPLSRGDSGAVTIDDERWAISSGRSDEPLAGIDAVINLAGEPISASRWSPAKRERIRASRIRTTETIARAIARAAEPPQVLISASAAGYYGSRGEEALEETSASGIGFLAEVCRAWEAATQPARDIGVRVATLRTGIVLGDGGLLARVEPIFRLGLGGRIGSGRQWMSWISLEDEVGAVRHLLSEESCHGAFNLAAPEPVRNSTFTEVLAAHVGRPARLVVPRPLLVAALGRRSADEMAVASQRLVPARLVASGYRFQHAALTDVLAPRGR